LIRSLNSKISILTIIPARSGSKRLPDKNLQLLQSQSLLEHSIRYATALGLAHCYVSTDGDAIKVQALKLGAQVIDRPTHLATDTTPTIAVLQHAVEHLNITEGWVVLLQPTNPLRPNGLLEKAFEKLKQSGADSLFTITPHHQKLGSLQNGKFKPYNYAFGQRSQDMEALYFENGLLYITSPKLIKQSLIMGPKHTTLIVDHPYARVDIDTQEDLDYARYVAAHFKSEEY
jgi:N-acylneuraminate cytidylyltransferase